MTKAPVVTAVPALPDERLTQPMQFTEREANLITAALRTLRQADDNMQEAGVKADDPQYREFSRKLALRFYSAFP